MPNPVSVRSSAFNVENARAAMLDGLQIPRGMVQDAIDTTHRKLTAKKRHFFTFQGEVKETADVEDHAIQLAAADKILDLTGLKARERDSAPQNPGVALEFDSATGVVRLVVGGLGLSQAMETALPSVIPTDDASFQLELPLALEEAATRHNLRVIKPVTPMQEDEPQIVKVRRGTLPEGVYAALFGESESNGHS